MDNTSVLVVEDDPDLREALCQTLTMAGYEALEAENAEAALSILDNRKLSLIISDVQMPGMHGDELLKLGQHDAGGCDHDGWEAVLQQGYQVLEVLKGRDLAGKHYQPLFSFYPVEKDYA